MEQEQIKGTRGTPPTSAWDSGIDKVKEFVSPTITDSDADWAKISTALDRKAAGMSWEEIYKDADNASQTKGYVARYYKSMYPDYTDAQVAEMAGANYSSVARVTSSIGEDLQTGIASFVGKTGLGVRKIAGVADSSDDIIRERIQGWEDDKDYMQAYTAQYNKDGSRDIDIQQAEFIGNTAVPALLGGTIGAVAKTKAGALAADMTLASVETTIESAAEESFDWGRYPVNLAVNLASTLVGGLLFPGGNEVINSYNKEQLQSLAGGMKLLGDLDVPISSDMLNDPALMKKTIEKAIKDPWKRKEALDAVENLNAKVVNEIKRISNSVGATPKQLADFKAGKISAREIGGKFRDMAESESIGKQGKVNIIRDSMKNMDFDEAGKPRVYKLGDVTEEGELTGFLRELVEVANDNDTVKNYINRQIKFRGQLSGDDSLAASTIINKHTKLLNTKQESARSLKLSTAELGLRRNKFKTLADKKKELELSLKEARDSGEPTDSFKQDLDLVKSRIDKQKVLIKDSQDLMKSSTITLEEATKDLGRTLTDYRKLKADSGGALADDYSAASLVEDPTEFSGMDMESLVKSINEKINVGGGAISTSDKVQVGILRRMKAKLLAKMDETITDPAFMEARKASNKLTTEKYNLITDQGGIKGLKNAMKSSDPKDFFRLFSSDEHGVSNLKNFKDLNGGEYPKEYNEMLNKVYSGKVLEGVEDVGSYNLGLNFGQLKKNLNEDDFIPDLMELAEPEVVESFKSLKGLVDAYGDVFTSIGNERAQLIGPDKGWAAKLGDLMELIGSPIKGLKAATEHQVQPFYDTIQNIKGSPKRMFWYEEKAQFSDSIKDTLSRIKELDSPQEKKALLDLTVTEFIGKMIRKDK